MRRVLVPVAIAAAIVAASAGAEASRPSSGARCAPGTTAAVIGGKKVCLKAGQKCDRRKDRQYHKYKFHCHSGRLARFPKPKPPTTPPPPSLPGLKVDVGGYKLYIDCIGSGSPTVILEGGGALAAATNPLRGWEALQTSIGSETRVCAYDRAGLGASDARPASLAPTDARLADELHALLVGANVPGPYVLVGPSYAGLILPSHVTRYPADYVGLVFLDSFLPCPGQCSFDAPEPGIFDVSAVGYGDRPVVVVTSPLFEFAGPDIARRSTNSILADSPLDAHNIAGTNLALTLDAVGLVIAAVRAGTHLPPCEQTTLPSRGANCKTIVP